MITRVKVFWCGWDSVILRILAVLTKKVMVLITSLLWWVSYQMSPVYKPNIICENQAVLFLPLKCFSLDKGFDSGSGGQIWCLEEVRVFHLPYLMLLCSVSQSIFYLSHHQVVWISATVHSHSVSAYESINQTQKAFLWLLWAKTRTNHQKPSCAHLSAH